MCSGDYLDIEQVKEEAIKVIDETHNLFKDDPIQGLVPRLPSNKLIPYGPFQIWFHKVEEIIKVNQSLRDVILSIYWVPPFSKGYYYFSTQL